MSSSSPPPTSPSRARFREPLAPKVPEITALFWVTKILTTGMGEATADYLAHVNLVMAGAVGLVGFVVALWLQFRVRRYSAPVYWFAVVMVAVFGTMAADGPPIGHLGSAIFYALVLVAVLHRWNRGEGTLSIHSITTRRRETYYWVTVLATFALGTAAGDVTADTMHLGYLPSGVLFAVVITVPAIAWWRFGLNEVAAFWLAYIVTRPLGASFADWLGKPRDRSGVGLGDGVVSAIATVLIVILVAYLALTRRDIQRWTADAGSQPGRHRPGPSLPAGAIHDGAGRGGAVPGGPHGGGLHGGGPHGGGPEDGGVRGDRVWRPGPATDGIQGDEDTRPWSIPAPGRPPDHPAEID